MFASFYSIISVEILQDTGAPLDAGQNECVDVLFIANLIGQSDGQRLSLSSCAFARLKL